MENHYGKYNKDRYTTLLIKKELKEKLKLIIVNCGRKLSYPQSLDFLIDYYNNNELDKKNIDNLFNDENNC
jgi:hypothetical protein